MWKINLPQKCFVTLTELQGNSCNVISMFPVMLMGCPRNEAPMETFHAHLKNVPRCCARIILFLIRRLFSPQVHWRRTVLLTRGPCWAFARAQAPQGESTSGGNGGPHLHFQKKKNQSWIVLFLYPFPLNIPVNFFLVHDSRLQATGMLQIAVNSWQWLWANGLPSFIFSSALRLCWASLVFSM